MIFQPHEGTLKRKVILKFSSSTNQYKKYCLVSGFSLVEWYKSQCGFLSQAVLHVHNPESHCLSGALPFCNSCFRQMLSFKSLKEEEPSCFVTSVQFSKTGVYAVILYRQWNLHCAAHLYLEQTSEKQS